MVKQSRDEELRKESFVSSALDLAYAEDPTEVGVAALKVWAFFEESPTPLRFLDKAHLTSFISLPAKTKFKFSRSMRKEIVEVYESVANGKYTIRARREYLYSLSGAERVANNLFEHLSIVLFENNKKIAARPFPVLALEALEILLELPPGLKACKQCNRLFFNTRENAKFCGDKCRYRHHYEKKRAGE